MYWTYLRFYWCIVFSLNFNVTSVSGLPDILIDIQGLNIYQESALRNQDFGQEYLEYSYCASYSKLKFKVCDITFIMVHVSDGLGRIISTMNGLAIDDGNDLY